MVTREQDRRHAVGAVAIRPGEVRAVEQPVLETVLDRRDRELLAAFIADWRAGRPGG